MRPCEHEDDENEGVNNHAVLGDFAKPHGKPLELRDVAENLGEDGEEDGCDADSDSVTHSAEDDHDDDVHGADEVEALGVDVLLLVGEKRAGDSRECCADDEREDFVFRRVDAHRLGGNLVVAHSEEAAPVGGVDEIMDDVNRERGKAEDPKEVRIGWHAGEAALCAERLGVLDNDADDFVEAERDDGEVVAF